jgi:hypothetical protein
MAPQGKEKNSLNVTILKEICDGFSPLEKRVQKAPRLTQWILLN